MSTLSFGDAGADLDTRIMRVALRNVAYCAREARTVSYAPNLRRDWYDLMQIAMQRALAHGATPDQVRQAGAGGLG